MITIKNEEAISIMREAGVRLATIFTKIEKLIKADISSAEIDRQIEVWLGESEMRGESKGFYGYRHVSCISFNDEVVHGVPSNAKLVKIGDLVKVDICASWQGYCVDMARTFFVGEPSKKVKLLIYAAQASLDAGIAEARPGRRLSDISAAIQRESKQYGIVRDFAGHGIGKTMHEAPEIANFGKSGQGPLLKAGMTFAIEPMITMGDYPVYVAEDGWTVKTRDKSLAAHVEDTVLITENEPEIFTRLQNARIK